jgi:glycosyltransferase involved in cell wall biosynthesis
VSTTPRLSIGLPVYNGEDYLANALDDLLDQSYEGFELIISDNASTDGTAELCRSYAKQDSRIRYIRQPHNIGSAPNHNFVFAQSRGELFKWAAADDLYAQELLQRCVDALDEDRDVVLAHSWTAAIDSTGKVIQALEYPLATDSSKAPDRFRSMLFGCDGDDYGVIRADDMYGVIRADVLRKVAPHGSYYHADRTIMIEVALHGRFYQVPEWLYFRRDHPDRANSAPTVRTWCAKLDPLRANRIRHPTVRLVSEYILGYVAAIRRAPLSSMDRRECYRNLAEWAASRTLPTVGRSLRGSMMSGEPVSVAPPVISVDAAMAARERRPS